MSDQPFRTVLLLVIIVVPMVFAWMLGHDPVFIVAIGALAASMQAANFSMQSNESYRSRVVETPDEDPRK